MKAKTEAAAEEGSFLSSARNTVILLVLVIVPSVLGLGYLLWELHTPKPDIRTPVVINRNSLLPHRFAGVCENCHRVADIGPVELNSDNMQLFNLSAAQRQLVLAGQRVEAPTIIQRLRVPAIKRTEWLPHPYVGVCSNCHVVLDIKPSEQDARAALKRAYQPVSVGTASPDRVARGGVRPKPERAFWRNVFGFLALGFGLVGVVYIVMRVLLNRYPAKFKGKFKIKPWFIAHEWCSTGFTLSVIAHWYFSERGNNFLHIALLIAIWLTLAGYVLRYRMAEKQTQKNVRLVHGQRGLSLALLLLLIVGHFFADFY